MKELLRILSIMAILSVTQSSCTEGCLACGLDNKCILCNKNFYLKENSCIKSELENCQTIDLNGNCLVCKNGFYKEKDKKDCT